MTFLITLNKSSPNDSFTLKQQYIIIYYIILFALILREHFALVLMLCVKFKTATTITTTTMIVNGPTLTNIQRALGWLMTNLHHTCITHLHHTCMNCHVSSLYRVRNLALLIVNILNLF